MLKKSCASIDSKSAATNWRILTAIRRYQLLACYICVLRSRGLYSWKLAWQFICTIIHKYEGHDYDLLLCYSLTGDTPADVPLMAVWSKAHSTAVLANPNVMLMAESLPLFKLNIAQRQLEAKDLKPTGRPSGTARTPATVSQRGMWPLWLHTSCLLSGCLSLLLQNCTADITMPCHRCAGRHARAGPRAYC